VRGRFAARHEIRGDEDDGTTGHPGFAFGPILAGKTTDDADGVLVWVDPLSDGRTRYQLDAMLREIASHGIWVSTHPDVTEKMGVKEVLYTTQFRRLREGVSTSS
jgi:hypothetical protein